jgi:hypothetical protein
LRRPFTQACGDYVDHFWVRKSVVNLKHERKLRAQALLALTGHFQPETIAQRAERRRQKAAAAKAKAAG